MKQNYDLVVIGAGPGGYCAAIHAAKKGMDVAIVEQEKFGGTCLNYGCMPTKIMLDAVSQKLEKQAYMEVSFDRYKLFVHRNNAVKKLTGGVEFLLKKNKVDILKGKGRFLDQNHIELCNTAGEATRIEFAKAIIATGSTAKTLPFLKGFEEFVLDSNQATNMEAVPESVCIIGGGVIGIEFAYIYKGFGCDVTVVEVLDRVLINEERIVSDFIKEELEKKGIKIFTGAQIQEINKEDGEVRIQLDEDEIAVQKILCAVGRQPNTEGLETEVLGDGFLNEKGAIIVDRFLQTKCDHIYAIGDVSGGIMLAHTASAQGIIAVDNIRKGNQAEWDASFVPRCVYIEPEIASVGITEEEINGKREYLTSLYPYGVMGKAIALNKEKGLVKIIADAATRQILGMTIMGARATDMICLGMEYIRRKSTIDELRGGIFPHPTFSEALHEAILKIDEEAIHN